MKNAVLIIALALFTSCGGPEVWIPQGSAYAAVTREHVQFWESPPQRPYLVIGIITPESGKYETEAEAVKAMRKELLIQKYGKPNVETQKTDKDVFRKSVWQSAKAQIKLGYLSTPLISESNVILSYAIPADTDNL